MLIHENAFKLSDITIMIKDAQIFQNLEFYDYANHFQYGRRIALPERTWTQEYSALNYLFWKNEKQFTHSMSVHEEFNRVCIG